LRLGIEKETWKLRAHGTHEFGFQVYSVEIGKHLRGLNYRYDGPKRQNHELGVG
jgi:hypothetical protein